MRALRQDCHRGAPPWRAAPAAVGLGILGHLPEGRGAGPAVPAGRRPGRRVERCGLAEHLS
eukprot:11208040-Lingulodinium_polyedra.AAC.1